MEEKKCIFCGLNPVKDGEEICSSCSKQKELEYSQNKDKWQEKVVNSSNKKAKLFAAAQGKSQELDTDYQNDDSISPA